MGFYELEWEDCYQVTWIQHYRSQLVVNRQFYRALNSVPVDLSDLADEAFTFENTYMGPLQVQALTYDVVAVLALFGTKQSFQKYITGANGQDGGAGLSPFFGMRFRLVPADSRVRKGRKILSGVSELMTDGDNLAGGYATDVNDYCQALASGLLVNGQGLGPVLLSPGNMRHQTILISTVEEVQYAGWSTQNSRKIGRGA